MDRSHADIHLKTLSTLFRQKRFVEAMEYLDKLTPQQRAMLGRLIASKSAEKTRKAS